MHIPRDLNPIPLEQALNGLRNGSGMRIITMAEGQWDEVLAAAYQHGWVLLEMDKDEKPARAYRKVVNGTS